MAAPLSTGELVRFKMAAREMNHRFSLLTPGGNAMAARQATRTPANAFRCFTARKAFLRGSRL